MIPWRHYDKKKETIKVHSFPKNAARHDRWVTALPNTLPKSPANDMVVCVWHCPVNHETYKTKGHQVPVDPPSLFSTPRSFVLHGLNASPRNPEGKYTDCEPRLKATQ